MRLLQLRICIGSQRPRFAQTEAKLAKHRLALTHPQPHPIASCVPDLLDLGGPLVGDGDPVDVGSVALQAVKEVPVKPDKQESTHSPLDEKYPHYRISTVWGYSRLDRYESVVSHPLRKF